MHNFIRELQSATGEPIDCSGDTSNFLSLFKDGTLLCKHVYIFSNDNIFRFFENLFIDCSESSPLLTSFFDEIS